MSDDFRQQKEPALEKRIRRRVTARQWDFFAATSPGIEEICRNECKGHPFFKKAPEIRKGGLEFAGNVHLSYLANLHLRTVNRILMRIGEFKATNFRQLRKKIAEFPWELFIKTGGGISVKVSSKGSRLYHTQAVEERVGQVLRGEHGFSEPSNVSGGNDNAQLLKIRIVDDLVTLSLDSTGENLYKRGLKTHGGKAPLRETTASAILRAIDYTGRETLIDPMCGSGTFSLEAAMIAQNIPAGWNRRFAFFQWPCFSPGKWRYMRGQARDGFRVVEKPVVFASDIDTEVCRELEKCIKKAGFENTVQVGCGLDFFDLVPSSIAKSRGAVVLNPPYGCRMAPEDTDAKRLYLEIFKKLQKDYKGWKAAIIVPEPGPPIGGLSKMKRMRFFHGGLDLILYYGYMPG